MRAASAFSKVASRENGSATSTHTKLVKNRKITAKHSSCSDFWNSSETLPTSENRKNTQFVDGDVYRLVYRLEIFVYRLEILCTDLCTDLVYSSVYRLVYRLSQICVQTCVKHIRQSSLHLSAIYKSILLS